MTRGVLLFAYQNSAVDYVRMAQACAARVQKHLGVDVCVVSDVPVEGIRTVLHTDSSSSMRDYGSGTAVFRNESRALASDLSPFDETLVLDVDYVVQTSRLNSVWESAVDFMIGSTASDLDGTVLDSMVGTSKLPQVWATVVYFQKTQCVRALFNRMKLIAAGWDYYAALYGIQSSLFRNDYLFAIALHILNEQRGLPEQNLLPWSILTAGFDKTLLSLEDGALFSSSSNQYRVRSDVHVLNKSEVLL